MRSTLLPRKVRTAIQGAGNGNVIQGNWIGVQRSSRTRLGAPIAENDPAINLTGTTTVGGLTPGAGNVIAGRTAVGGSSVVQADTILGPLLASGAATIGGATATPGTAPGNDRRPQQPPAGDGLRGRSGRAGKPNLRRRRRRSPGRGGQRYGRRPAAEPRKRDRTHGPTRTGRQLGADLVSARRCGSDHRHPPGGPGSRSRRAQPDRAKRGVRRRERRERGRGHDHRQLDERQRDRDQARHPRASVLLRQPG